MPDSPELQLPLSGHNDRLIVITLPYSAWLTVAHYLGFAPYRDVVNILAQMSAQVDPHRPNEMDCVIDDGKGNQISGKQLARECLAEWQRILQSEGLPIDRVS
jgi:hypothetical protein